MLYVQWKKTDWSEIATKIEINLGHSHPLTDGQKHPGTGTTQFVQETQCYLGSVCRLSVSFYLLPPVGGLELTLPSLTFLHRLRPKATYDFFNACVCCNLFNRHWQTNSTKPLPRL
jgi:hypothetical protein